MLTTLFQVFTKQSLRTRGRLENNIDVDLKEIGYEDAKWMELGQLCNPLLVW
jgi:hypothetical protein